MFSTILSGAIYGMHSYLVRVEVDMSRGLPCFAMVGSLGNEVKESGERVRIALKNRGICLPPVHIAVNFSPADIRKEGTAFDLPLAAAILLSLEQLEKEATDHILIMGELGLDGEVKPVKGVLPIVKTAYEHGVRRCVVPAANRGEAEVIEGMQTVGVKSLEEMIRLLQNGWQSGKQLSMPEKGAALPGKTMTADAEAALAAETAVWPSENSSTPATPYAERLDFADIAGQEGVKRAALLAAAGFHNLLISGPPGSGKTMVARRMSGILPPMSGEESLEVSSIYSIAGLLDEKRSFLTTRPFLNPHHTISPQAMTGGGRVPRPGVISLAHRGVLFLDEMPQFARQTLETLRQPLEDKKVQIARSSGSFVYPADFMLVGAMNPCPCGYYPDRNRCRCTPFELARYRNRISGPVLDRIDIKARAPRVAIEQLQQKQRGMSSRVMRDRVMSARERQEFRYRGTPIRFNADLGGRDMEQYCHLGNSEKKLMEQLFHTLELTARAYYRLLKVARTVADVDGSEEIREIHLTEAACSFAGGEEADRDE